MPLLYNRFFVLNTLFLQIRNRGEQAGSEGPSARRGGRRHREAARCRRGAQGWSRVFHFNLQPNMSFELQPTYLICPSRPPPFCLPAAIVVRSARVRQSCCCRRDARCFSHCIIVTIYPAGDDGRLFGSVSAEEIAAAIKVLLHRSVLNFSFLKTQASCRLDFCFFCFFFCESCCSFVLFCFACYFMSTIHNRSRALVFDAFAAKMRHRRSSF